MVNKQTSLRAARIAADMSQTDLARLMRKDRSFISRLERGEREGTLQTWKAAGRALKMDWRLLVR